MLNKVEGLKVINQLLDGAETSPRRYIAVAYLMQADLTAFEQETLDDAARRMEDVQRRLDLGRAGPKVRKVEDGVVELLDKLIKKLEDEQNKGGGGGGQAKQSIKSTSPAQKSAPIGGKGNMDVDKKDIGHESGWGNMLPKEREEVLQHMGRDFPPHFRDAIENYYRKLATQPTNDEDK
jgi:hypothetical protein